MAAAGITALLKKMDYKDVVVAIGNLDMVHTIFMFVYISSFLFLIFRWFSVQIPSAFSKHHEIKNSTIDGNRLHI